MTPLSFATAVIAAMEQPKEESCARKTENEDDEHYHPFVVG